MKLATKAAVLCAVALTSFGTATASHAADAKPAKKPSLHSHGQDWYPPGALTAGTIRSYGNFGNKGHLGCSLFRHVEGNPKLHNLHPDPHFYPHKDNTSFIEKDHNLNPKRRYFYKLRCGTPFRTVASSSAMPTEPSH